MDEVDPGGMQSRPGNEFAFRPVYRVSQKRMTAGRKVKPDLMGSSRNRESGDKRSSVQCLQCLITGLRVKTSRINADFYYAELDVSVRTGYEELIKFIQAVDKVSPRVSWRRFDIRPDRRPPHLGGANNQGSITARVLSEDNSSKITTRVGFNGTLRMIGFDGKVAVRNPKTGGSAK